MNRRQLLTASTGALLGAGAVALRAQTTPRPAMELPIQLPNGSKIMLSQYKGKNVVLAMLLTT